MNLEIKQLASSSKDLITLTEWFFKEWGHYHKDQDLQGCFEYTKTFCGKGDQSVPMTFAAYLGEEVVGTINLSLDDLVLDPPLNPWLASLYVKESHRGQGIAKKLIHHLLDQTKSMGIPKLYLFTKDQVDLYKRFGFREWDHRVHYGDEITIMEVNL